MIFDIKQSDNKKVEEMYERAMKELEEFFEFEWKTVRPKLILIPNREVFDGMHYDEKTEDWVIGSTMNTNDFIGVLTPEGIEKDSSHKYSDESYYSLIKHELCHQFENKIRDSYHPLWLGEGLAEYASGQITKMKKPEVFSNFIKYFDYEDGGIYQESTFAVWILIEEFGKKKFLEFLKISDVENEKEFNKIFKEFFGIELSYDWFNKILEKKK